MRVGAGGGMFVLPRVSATMLDRESERIAPATSPKTC
jgi:hypothetical protein